jgi:hypothetical protein
MHCPNCRAELAEGTQMCPGCGVRLPLICPQCGSPLPQGGRFCPACGLRVVETSGEAMTDPGDVATGGEVTTSLPPLPLPFFGLPTPGVDLVWGESPVEQEE